MSHVHFIGVGGVGMSALARLLLARGETVSGSDLYLSEITGELERLGARIYQGHRSEYVDGADEVVVSAAVPPDNPEVVAARARGIPVIHRAQLLARLIDATASVAVTGAHGKTTVTSMIALSLLQAGFDVQPVIGGEVRGGLPGDGHPYWPSGVETGPAGREPKRPGGSWVVAEADESDGSFLYYHPLVAVVTNIEPDHLEHYEGSFARLVDAYRRFLGQVRSEGMGVVGVDSPALREVVRDWPRPLVRYGLDPAGEPDWTARIEELGAGSRAVVFHHGRAAGELRLIIPGRHNVVNALAALAVARWAGADLEAVFAALARFPGARRRFEPVGEGAGVRVVDDYAHHPSEIRETIAAARSLNPGRLWAVFQPHRFARTHYLLHDFPAAFREADVIVLTDIYSPPAEPPWPGVNGELLAQEVEKVLQRKIHYLPTLPEVIDFVLANVRPGDLVLCMGAGDITWAAREIGRRLASGARPASEVRTGSAAGDATAAGDAGTPSGKRASGADRSGTGDGGTRD